MLMHLVQQYDSSRPSIVQESKESDFHENVHTDCMFVLEQHANYTDWERMVHDADRKSVV